MDSDRLRSPEWGQRDRFDIIGSLPLELLVQVLQYLDLTDIVRSQRVHFSHSLTAIEVTILTRGDLYLQVSKKWRRVFSSDIIIKPILRETIAFLGLNSKDADRADVNATSYFRWRHRLQCARPVRRIFFHWPAGLVNLQSDVSYHSRRLCFYSRAARKSTC